MRAPGAQVNLGPMTSKELAFAIRRPAERGSRYIRGLNLLAGVTPETGEIVVMPRGAIASHARRATKIPIVTKRPNDPDTPRRTRIVLPRRRTVGFHARPAEKREAIDFGCFCSPRKSTPTAPYRPPTVTRIVG